MKDYPKKKKSFVFTLSTIAAGFFLLFALVSPILFIRPSGLVIFNDKTAHIGNTFGIMSPFIAIAAAIITFAAFWVQYKANEHVIEQGRRQNISNKKEQQAAEIRNRKQLIVSRFYEMLKIHQDNVKEIGGRNIFYYHLSEFNFIYSIINTLYPEKNTDFKIERAYNIFYKGVEDERFPRSVRRQMQIDIEEGGWRPFSDISPWAAEKINRLFEEFRINWENQPYPLFQGHFEELNNYYRHLFLTVKTIAKENVRYLSYNEKRDLLRILRAQLTNTEQVMLCYNWKSGNGRQWEEDSPAGNHFFTQYRMVHNITADKIIAFQQPEAKSDMEAFDKFKKDFESCEFIKRFGSREDPMFEFEDWEGYPKFDYR